MRRGVLSIGLDEPSKVVGASLIEDLPPQKERLDFPVPVDRRDADELIVFKALSSFKPSDRCRSFSPRARPSVRTPPSCSPATCSRAAFVRLLLLETKASHCFSFVRRVEEFGSGGDSTIGGGGGGRLKKERSPLIWLAPFADRFAGASGEAAAASGRKRSSCEVDAAVNNESTRINSVATSLLSQLLNNTLMIFNSPEPRLRGTGENHTSQSLVQCGINCFSFSYNLNEQVVCKSEVDAKMTANDGGPLAGPKM